MNSPKQPLQDHIRYCRQFSQMVSLCLQDTTWTHPISFCKVTSMTAVCSHRWFHFVNRIPCELTPSAFARSYQWLPSFLTDGFMSFFTCNVNQPHQPLQGHIGDCRRFSQMVAFHLHFFLLLFYSMVIDHLTVTFWSGLSDICSFEIYPFMKRPMTCFEYMIMIVY